MVSPALPPDQTTFKPGHAFGSRYRIVQLLGVGGMGAVYKARDAELSVDVALKVVRPEIAADPAAARDLQQRFKRELLLARQVTHKNVVRIHDIGEMDGIKYITMPFIEGEDLIAIMRREGPLPLERTLRILRGALSGLVAAHAAGVVHRDLKPANIMVAAGDEALIMDFGIARLSEPADTGAAAGTKPGGGPSTGSTSSSAFLRESLAADGQTQLGSVVGTIEYMAPEQAAGLLVDQRADIYSLGLIVHEMLSGLRTFETTAKALADLTFRRKTPPPLLRSLSDAVPETIERVVAKCLSPNADNRYQTSAELAAELDQLDDRGVPLPRPQKLLRSPKFWVAASVLVGHADRRHMVGGRSAGNDAGGREAAPGVDSRLRLRERHRREGVRRNARSLGGGRPRSREVRVGLPAPGSAARRAPDQRGRAAQRSGEPARRDARGHQGRRDGAHREEGESVHHFRQGRRPGNRQGGLRHPGQREQSGRRVGSGRGTGRESPIGAR